MRLKRILYSIHRILGTILSILFLVWFLSGFVMIYHTFPKVSNKDRYACADTLLISPISIDTLLHTLPDKGNITQLKLTSFGNQPYLEAVTINKSYKIPYDSTIVCITSLSYTQIEDYAKRWCDAEIVKVDTLRELEQWIPFGHLRKHFPIYKFYFEDKDKHQLYLSSVTGEALQFTDKNNRLWAWLGAIPHWVYFTSLRQNSQLWVDVVIWLSGIGCIMCIAGIILGIQSYVNRYKKKKNWKTPYRKFAYKWHHILGFIFGIFVFTFVFSGMMSLATVPKWMVKVHNPGIQQNLFLSKPIQFDKYKLDITKIAETYPNDIKSIEWSSFGKLPLYKVVTGNKLLTIDASSDTLKMLKITETDIQQRLAGVHKEPLSISVITEYDNYYVGTSNHLPLPVYKVAVADADNSTYYINPTNGNIWYYNTNTKVRRWTYQALHSFEMGFLVKHPVLWNSVMWVTMIGGTLVSITGVWLGFRYIVRKIKKLKKYICNPQKKKVNF